MRKIMFFKITTEGATLMPRELPIRQSHEYLLQVTRVANGCRASRFAWMTVVAHGVAVWITCCWFRHFESWAALSSIGVGHVIGDSAPERCTKGICCPNCISRELYRNKSWKKARLGCRRTWMTGGVKRGQWNVPRSTSIATCGPAAREEGWSPEQ